MKKIVFITLFVCAGAMALFFGLKDTVHTFFTPPEVVIPLPENPRYRDVSLPVEERITNLLTYMTLKEKVGQMALVEKNSVHDMNDLASYGIGAVLSGQGAKPEENTIEGWKEMVEEFSETAIQSRLRIPLLYGVDAIHGHTNVPGATIFPHAIGLGASGDAELVERIARATAKELLATGIHWNFAPNLDLPQDIRWGRTFETFTDDPELASELGRAYVRGLQMDDHGSSSAVLSTPKHYIGAGGMIYESSSNKDYLIDQGTTAGNETLLREVYLPPFEAVVEEGVSGILVGLNAWGKSDSRPEDYSGVNLLREEWGFKGPVVAKINQWLKRIVYAVRGIEDTKLSANKYLVTDILKDELGFEGFVVSDWYAVYEIPGDDYRAAVTAINAGIDLVMLPFEYKEFVKNVTTAVEKGEVTEERIDDAVRRILRAKFDAGLFDAPEELEQEIAFEEHKALAREAVAASLVLLKNDEDVLPLKAAAQHIRVAGSAADNVGMQSGGWTLEWQGVDGNWLPGGTSILEGIKEVAPPASRIEFNATGTFAGTEKADVGIAIVGEKPYAEGWGDKKIPTLDADDLETIARLKEASEKVVVVIVSGRPLLITDDLPQWDALVAAWLPGAEGAGVADALFGEVPFTGTLPLPWPAYLEQLPISLIGQSANGTPLLFPRYFGL